MIWPWRRRRREAELDEEIRGHLAMAARDHEAQGESPREAAYAARREFGNATLVKEVTRESWGGMWLEQLGRDLRFALRSLMRRPGLAVAAVLCFALGIGANVTMFGVLDTLLFRAPPRVRDANGVVRLYFKQGAFTEGATSFPMYEDLAAGVPALSSVGAYWRMDVVVGRGLASEKARASLVSSSYLSLLGVQAIRGRLFGPDEDRQGSPSVAVLSSAYAERLFGADSLAIGRFVTVGAAPYAVVGVVPTDFSGVDLEPVDLWVPLGAAAPTLFARDALTNRYDYWLEVVGRLRPQLSTAEAAAQASLVWRRAQAAVRRDSTTASVVLAPIQAARGPFSSDAKVPTLLALLSAVLLLIACANVANLLLARTLSRRPEIAVRLALGAGRAVLLRHSFLESFVLAASGGAAAIFLSLWAGVAVRRYILPQGVAFSPMGGRILAFVGVLTLLSAVATGLPPALQASRPSLSDVLKSGIPRGSARRSPAQTGLLVAQVALTLVLVAGAGLFVRSLQNVLSADFGYDTRSELLATMDFRGFGYKNDQMTDVYRQLLERARTIPGVEAAALSMAGPLQYFFGMNVQVPGRGLLRPKHGTYYQAVGADYFRTMGSRLVRGRSLSAGDRAGAPKVAVMGEAMAHLAFPGEEAVGRCVMLGSDKDCWEVVGVVADAKQWSATESPYPIIYVSLEQWNVGPNELYIRVRGPAERFVPVVRRELQAVDPIGPYVDVTSLGAIIDPQYRPWRLGATVLGLFGALALLLSGLGLYGVLAYVVGQRTREIGVRVALGANPGSLFSLVLGEGLRIVAAGVLVGALASLALGKLVASLLYGVSPRDPWVLAASASVLLAAAALACLIPARRAATVDPTVALRYE
ncbi:MAG: ADOP family duplicated permease [Gemmatimonadales bacterium]